MTKKELEILLSRVEGIKSLLESNSLEQFQQEVLKVENYLKRFGSLAELLSHLEKLENMAYAAKDFLSIDEVATYLNISKSSVYKINGKNIFILRSDLNDWIKRNPCLSNDELEKQANIVAYNLERSNKQKRNNKNNKL